jgi:antitoxin (DNA-binding transcriptional repressor) of toxin-antitoxin stability system
MIFSMGMSRRSKSTAPPGSTIITVTEASRSFADIVNRAYYRRQHFILTRAGRPLAGISPLPEHPPITASSLRKVLQGLPHLDRAEADAFGQDIEEARGKIPTPGDDPWESSSTARS